MPLDDMMWRDGTKFDPDNPRLSYDGPPKLPPNSSGGGLGGEPRNEKSNDLFDQIAVIFGYGVFAFLGCSSGSFEVAVTFLTQTFAAGSSHYFLDRQDFDGPGLGRSIGMHVPGFLKNWDEFSVLKKTFKSSAFALCVTIPASLGFAYSKYRPIDDPSFGQVAVELIKSSCQIVDLYQISVLKDKFCRDKPTPQ